MHRRRQPPLRKDLPPEFFDTPRRMRVMVGTLVLNNHPTGISVEDLRYELSADEDDDSVDQAIGAMTNEGLLRRKGQMVLLTFTPSDARVGLPRRRQHRRRCRSPRRRGDQHDPPRRLG